MVCGNPRGPGSQSSANPLDFECANGNRGGLHRLAAAVLQRSDPPMKRWLPERRARNPQTGTAGMAFDSLRVSQLLAATEPLVKVSSMNGSQKIPRCRIGYFGRLSREASHQVLNKLMTGAA